MAKQFTNPDDAAIRTLMQKTRAIAVLGLSSKPGRPSYGVARALQSFGYRVIPVNPNETEVLGEPSVGDLADIDADVDLVDVFRAPEHVPAIVDQCLDLGLSAIWLQEGVVAPEAAGKAREGGMEVVMDRCLFKEYRRLL
jgi:predicted CoA-binding protein